MLIQVIQSFGQAITNFGDIGFWLFMVGGALVGVIVGIIPGIGNLMAMALFLSFVFMLTPAQALPFMVAAVAGGYTGGAITAILLNIPGDEPAAATLLDGYPMNQKGEGGRAIGAALVGSALGGVIAGLLALVMIPLILPMVMSIGSPEMVFVVLLGLSFVAVLGSGSMLKGLTSAVLGLLISFIGMQTATAVPRFAFGSAYLYDGIGMVPIILGLFAIPEIVILTIRGGTIAQEAQAAGGTHGVWEGARDVFRHWKLTLRSSAIGYLISIVPGVGAIAVSFITYGQAKATSRHPETFGKGNVEGVIAPEAANNACQGGALLTLLALGIPTGAASAMLMGALLMLGIIPGPGMMREHMDISLMIIFILIAGNIIAAIMCMCGASFFAKIAYIPSRILAPLVLAIAFVGVYAFRESYSDIIVAIIFGILGLAMRRYSYNIPVLFLGYILGDLFEKYFFISLSAAGPLFFLRPISLVLILIIISIFALGPLRKLMRRRGAKST